MAQTYRRRIDRLNRKDRKKKEFAESTEVVLGQQKKKKKLIGVDKVRFYPEKNSEKVSALLEALNTLERTDPDSLEDVFSKHRDAVQLQFNQSLDILTCVKGFFNSPIHCRKHCEYLGGTSLQENIDSDFRQEFDIMQCVLTNWCRTKAYKLQMESAELQCKELQGSKIPLYVALL